jgi:hypothetical protein
MPMLRGGPRGVQGRGRLLRSKRTGVLNEVRIPEADFLKLSKAFFAEIAKKFP